MAVYIPFNRVSCGLQAAASISTQRSVYYFHRNLSGRTLPCYPVFFAVCSTMCVLLLTLCVVMCAARWGCVPHARSGRRVDTLVCVFTTAAAAESLGVPSCVLLDKAIRASLHGLLLAAEDPAKCLTVVQKGHLPTNICSHCESLARLHTLEEGRHAGVHMQTCRKEMPHRG